jgi:hypothetical protein
MCACAVPLVPRITLAGTHGCLRRSSGADRPAPQLRADAQRARARPPERARYRARSPAATGAGAEYSAIGEGERNTPSAAWYGLAGQTMGHWRRAFTLAACQLSDAPGLAARARTTTAVATLLRRVLASRPTASRRAPLARHPPRYHAHFTPTYASWLNQVESGSDTSPRRPSAAARFAPHASCSATLAPSLCTQRRRPPVRLDGHRRLHPRQARTPSESD